MKGSQSLFITTLLLLFTGLLAACGPPENIKKEDGAPDFLKKIRGEPVVPRSANTIFIHLKAPRAENSTIVDKLRQKLVSQLTAKGRLAVTEKPQLADLAVRVTITAIQHQVTSFNSFGTPEKKRLLITARCTLREKNSHRPVFASVPLQAFREYSTVTAPVETDQEAEEKVLDELAARLVSQIHRGWHTDRMTDIEKGRKN